MGVHSYDELREHVGHQIACVTYGGDVNVSLECEDCNEVLLDFDAIPEPVVYTEKVDRYGRAWALPNTELCPICGQPDNCGDCSHARLNNDQARELGATNVDEPDEEE